MLILPINKSWVLSATVQKTYLICALLTLALLATRIGTRMAMSAAGKAQLSAPAARFVGILLLPEIIGAAMLWVGMWYFWFGFDNSKWIRKTVWFVLLFFTAPVGTVAYYFLAYRRSVNNP